jgi:hypothetical protein
MIWLEAPRWKRHAIDTGADFADCVPATLFGRRGVLIVHRQSQVRFYQPGRDALGPWPYREIYSIYTPSAQGGLLVADIDEDGREDIVCGNYWIRAPERFDLPWRLFAINGWWEQERSALLDWAVEPQPGGGANLIALQREGPRFSRFRPAGDRTQFWTEEPIRVEPPLDQPRTVLRAGADSGGRTQVYAGDRSRLLVIRDGKVEAMKTPGAVAVWPVADSVWILTARGVEVWRPQRAD